MASYEVRPGRPLYASGQFTQDPMPQSLQSLVESLGELGQVWPDSASVRATLGCGWSPTQRSTWKQLLRQAYSRQALTAGYAIFGRDLQIVELARLSVHAQAYLERVREAPALAPMLNSFVKVGVAPPADYAGLRQGALDRGLLPTAWKWLYRQPVAVVRKLFAFGWTPEAIFWTNLLAKARADQPWSELWLEPGRPYQMGLLYEQVSASACPQYVADKSLQLERLLRLMPAAPTVQTLQEFETLTAELHLGFRNPQWTLAVQRNSSWKGLLERQRRHHDERLARAAVFASVKAGGDCHWEAQFGSFESNGVKVTELTSNAELVNEGALLSHCVGDGAYVEGCLSGTHLIASLQAPSAQRATLQMRRNDATGRFNIGQLAGQGNSRVPQVFWHAARALQQQLNG